MSLLIKGSRGGLRPNWDDMFDQDSPDPDLKYHRPTFPFENTQVFSGTTGYLYMVPFIPKKDITVAEIGIYRNNTNAFDLIMGIYNSKFPTRGNLSGPDTLLVSAALLTTHTIGLHVPALASTNLTNDVLYWLAMKANGLSATAGAHNLDYKQWYTRGRVGAEAVSLGGVVPQLAQQCLFVSMANGSLDDDTLPSNMTGLISETDNKGPLLFLGE